jgi:uncharacterized protein YjbJ (UPF0337 family)
VEKADLRREIAQGRCADADDGAALRSEWASSMPARCAVARRRPFRARELRLGRHRRKSEPTGVVMNWDRIEGNWKQFRGKAREQWGKLTDDQLDVIAGKRDQLAGKLQEAYGYSKDEADRQIKDWETRLPDDSGMQRGRPS